MEHREMTPIVKEIVYMMLQFLDDDDRFKETVHKLEKDSGLYFNMSYFEELVSKGEWNEMENYLRGFTSLTENKYSLKLFFEIRKQKYFEALDKHDHAKAVEILSNDLNVFSNYNQDIIKEMSFLLTLRNFRQYGDLSDHGETMAARAKLFSELKRLIGINPVFNGKLQFPNMPNTRLQTLINQSLNWQHHLCRAPRIQPEIKTLLVDHVCDKSMGAQAPPTVTPVIANFFMGSIPGVQAFPAVTNPSMDSIPGAQAPPAVTNPFMGSIPVDHESVRSNSAQPSSAVTNPFTGSIPMDHESVRSNNAHAASAFTNPFTGSISGAQAPSNGAQASPAVTSPFMGSIQGAQAPPALTNNFRGPIPRLSGYPPLTSQSNFQLTPAPLTPMLPVWLSPNFSTASNNAGVAVPIPRYPMVPLMNPSMTFRAADPSGSASDVFGNTSPQLAEIVGPSGDGQSLTDGKSRFTDEPERSMTRKLCEISKPSQLRFLRVPDSAKDIRIVRLLYSYSGDSLVALGCDAVHRFWKWQKGETNTEGKATTSVAPKSWQPPNELLVTNDVCETSIEAAVPFLVFSRNDSYALSASGGRVTLYNTLTFKKVVTFMAPPPSPTSIALKPVDNNILAVGMEDSSIIIYNVKLNQVNRKLEGHSKRVTGLAFSKTSNVLVSAGADTQLCTWCSDSWKKKACKFLQIPSGRVAALLAPVQVQFHKDETHVLAVHQTHLAIYTAPGLDRVTQWIPRESSGSITDAAFSCCGESVYVTFVDGSVGILYATTLMLKCRISSTAYLEFPHAGLLSLRVYPQVIAAHPFEPHQFALGLTDGRVFVLEPKESSLDWGTEPSLENAEENSRPEASADAEMADEKMGPADEKMEPADENGPENT